MSGYIGSAPVPQSVQTRDSFIATAGQTSFGTSGYEPNFLDVYLNGIKLHSSDYTASNGTDVVLATGAAVNDVIEVVAFDSFEIIGSVDAAKLDGELPSHYLDFGNTTNKPTTVAGYGITDAHSGDFATLSNKPTTLSGYGITDAATSTQGALADSALQSYTVTEGDVTGHQAALSITESQISDLGTYETADSTILKDADIGVNVQAYDANIVSDATYVKTDENFTTADHSKLDGIETGATADQTKADIDALNIDSDTLDGQHGSYYTGYTDTAVANLVDSAPGTLDTLNELAAALGDDPNFATTVTNSIATKLPLAGGTMTGTISGFESTGIDDNASSTAMTLDSSGNVLIGTDTGDSFNADSRLRIGNSGDRAFLQFKTDASNNSGILFGTEADDVRHQIVHDVTDDAITFIGNSAEAMRLDASGNLLVGRTVTGDSTTGGMIRPDGFAQFTRDGAIAADFKRINSDGDIVRFQKDGAVAGSIGVVNDDHLYIGSNDGSDAYIKFSSNLIKPVSSSGADRHDAISLGTSSVKFKDGYFSGNLYGNGSNLTGVGGSTTRGDVGTYTVGATSNSNSTSIAAGATAAGNTLVTDYYNATHQRPLATDFNGAASCGLSGTWRNMGGTATGAAFGVRAPTLWVRIS